MTKATDICVTGAALTFLPVETRVPLKFGAEVLTTVTVARVRLNVKNRAGIRAVGWGETPLSVQWVWPGVLGYSQRLEALQALCVRLTTAWPKYELWGDPLELGHRFQRDVLPGLAARVSAEHDLAGQQVPWLAALVCCSPFDLALHDAFGQAAGLPVYSMYTGEYLNQDLGAYLQADSGSAVNFDGLYPADFLAEAPPDQLPAWHLVGGLDPLTPDDLTGDEPDDGYPLLLADWIRRDGLKCLKVKLRGDDSEWDYQRLAAVGEIGRALGVEWLTSDFNCTVTDPAYVNRILDRLAVEHEDLYAMLLYVEQPFPYDLEAHRIDVHSVSQRKPLFMDESAHDWQLVRLGRRLGWTGVALKTCKTQTGALLSLCWARAHGMDLMVQDLTNPMLAQIPHVQLAAHARTIMGVESNAMQFYPEASHVEAQAHPGLYRRRAGVLDLSTLVGPGFGYAGAEDLRNLPAPAATAGDLDANRRG